MRRFVQADRDQPMLLPPDLRDWVPENDLSHFIIEAVARVDMAAFKINERGCGSAQYGPRMMLALVIYCYANGIFSSRRIERATHRDVGVRLVSANTHPDHDTIAKFRRENFDAIAACFVQVLLLAKELKLLKVGTVSIDGTKIDANANITKSVRYDRAKNLVEKLEADIADLMQKAEAADASGEADPQDLPKDIARREALREKLDAACRTLEACAKMKAEKEKAEYEKKMKNRDQREGSAKGPPPKNPEDKDGFGKPEPGDQISLTDADSAIMRKSKRSEYRQAYNAQAAVDADGSQLIVGAEVSQCASDRGELAKDIAAIPAELGKPSDVLADNGFANGDEVKKVEDQGINALVATGAEGRQREYDFRPEKLGKEPKEPKAQWLKEMATKLETEEGREKYRLRQQTVEPVFGIIKSVLGFRQFSLRGINKVRGEWKLVVLAYNFKRLHNLIVGKQRSETQAAAVSA
ncbi:MAG: IS1182 family transposase [Pseudomonadota bacterium]